jgi:diguanylate cyclase
MLIAIVYRPDRPYRTNYLLLACAVVMLAASDRVTAYLRTIGAEHGELWSGIGFVLGPLLLAFAVLDLPDGSVPDLSRKLLDWVQMALPYVGFVGIAMIYVFHLLIGRRLTTVQLYAALVMILLITVRQVIAIRSQRMLTQRLMEAQSRLAHQVHHDPLTALPNRLLFAERLDGAVRKGPFVLIFVDLDDFKEVNDRFGHAGGDELLCAVGERLLRCIGAADTLARIGGDEFALIAPGAGEDGIERVVAGLDEVISHAQMPSGVGQVQATFGWAVSPGDGSDSNELFRMADQRLIERKRGGRRPRGPIRLTQITPATA